MDTLIVQNGCVVCPETLIENADLVVQEGKIRAIGPKAGEGFADAERVDAAGCFVWPGLIDLHIHGARGQMFGVGQEGDLAAIASALASKGVTRFVPTIPPMALGHQEAEISRIADTDLTAEKGAVPIGLHLEGPYLNSQRSGALSLDCLRYPDVQEFQGLVEASRGKLRIMTIAPELPGASEVLKAARDTNVVMAAGHTEASYTEMEEAIALGLSHLTHCFNAMRRISHRSPGPVEAALTNDRVTVDLICDGRHVHKSLVDIVLKCIGFDRTALVSDATAFQAKDGSLAFVDRQLEVRRGLVRDKQTGALGGSAISLWDAVQNIKEWFDLPYPKLARLGSLNPARILGEEGAFGGLEVGKV
ncbi:MAG: N-acetylglucosamine-6-phosphate deacetylase, partial [Planctomycetota bacterium]